MSDEIHPGGQIVIDKVYGSLRIDANEANSRVDKWDLWQPVYGLTISQAVSDNSNVLAASIRRHVRELVSLMPAPVPNTVVTEVINMTFKLFGYGFYVGHELPKLPNFMKEEGD